MVAEPVFPRELRNLGGVHAQFARCRDECTSSEGDPPDDLDAISFANAVVLDIATSTEAGLACQPGRRCQVNLQFSRCGRQCTTLTDYSADHI